jgi:DNA-binding transcriptional MerR regulator
MRDFSFSPPNRGALWSMLALTKTQLAEISGLTTRQISHWTSQGYITTSGRNPERYNGDAVDLCVLIKQGLASGIPLKRSVRMAQEYIAQELAVQPGMRVIQPPALLDIREKLRGAGASINTVLEVVSALVPETPEGERPLDEELAPVVQAAR